jgi:hypothetical protein
LGGDSVILAIGLQGWRSRRRIAHGAIPVGRPGCLC